MRHAMLCQKNADRYLLPVLTSYVRKQTDKDLAEALVKVKTVRETERESGQHVVSADEAMKYLLYLVDVNRLYDVALGLYDFDLVMFVAAKSNKDPKEYLPFLNKLRRSDFSLGRLRSISVSYICVTINGKNFETRC
jgi:IkappaB kinase complex, IKAP component